MPTSSIMTAKHAKCMAEAINKEAVVAEAKRPARPLANPITGEGLDEAAGKKGLAGTQNRSNQSSVGSLLGGGGPSKQGSRSGSASFRGTGRNTPVTGYHDKGANAEHFSLDNGGGIGSSDPLSTTSRSSRTPTVRANNSEVGTPKFEKVWVQALVPVGSVAKGGAPESIHIQRPLQIKPA